MHFFVSFRKTFHACSTCRWKVPCKAPCRHFATAWREVPLFPKQRAGLRLPAALFPPAEVPAFFSILSGYQGRPLTSAFVGQMRILPIPAPSKTNGVVLVPPEKQAHKEKKQGFVAGISAPERKKQAAFSNFASRWREVLSEKRVCPKKFLPYSKKCRLIRNSKDAVRNFAPCCRKVVFPSFPEISHRPKKELHATMARSSFSVIHSFYGYSRYTGRIQKQVCKFSTGLRFVKPEMHKGSFTPRQRRAVVPSCPGYGAQKKPLPVFCRRGFAFLLSSGTSRRNGVK